MEIFLHILFFVLGLAWLAEASEALIAGSIATARRFNVRPIVIGLTIVAYGTSAPEAVVSMLAASGGNIGISLGNVVGSNIANIGLILGVAALLSPVDVQRSMFRFEMPMLIIATAALWLVVYDGSFARWEGALLCIGAIVFTWLSYRQVDELGEEIPLPSPPRLGEILAEQEGLDTSDIDAALATQRKDKRLIGQILVENGAASEGQVAAALEQQQQQGAVEQLDGAVAIDPQHHHLMRLPLPVMLLVEAVALIAVVRLSWIYFIPDRWPIAAGLIGTAFALLLAAHVRAVLRRRGEARQHEAEAHRGMPVGTPTLLVFGMIGLAGGAKLMVDEAVALAHIWGVSDAVIGLTIVAIGTSLPELAACISAAARGAQDVSLGNVIGSNVFNVFVVIGLTALLFPLALGSEADYGHMIRVDLPVMTLFALATLPLFFTGWRLSRREGVMLLLGYVAFMAYTAWKEIGGAG